MRMAIAAGAGRVDPVAQRAERLGQSCNGAELRAATRPAPCRWSREEAEGIQDVARSRHRPGGCSRTTASTAAMRTWRSESVAARINGVAVAPVRGASLAVPNWPRTCAAPMHAAPQPVRQGEFHRVIQAAGAVAEGLARRGVPLGVEPLGQPRRSTASSSIVAR